MEDALQAQSLADPPAAPEVLEQLFLAHQARVYRAAYRITGNPSDAEDVVQTVFLRLARQSEGATAAASIEAYLQRAAANAALDVLRTRRAGQVPLEDTNLGEAEKALGSEPASGQLRLWLRQALARLHPRHAEMFVLRYFEGYENGEIAQMMHTSAAVVAVTLHRTRGQLQKEFRSSGKGTR